MKQMEKKLLGVSVEDEEFDWWANFLGWDENEKAEQDAMVQAAELGLKLY